MTAYISYIGDIESPDFSWDNPSHATRLPRRVIPPGASDSLGVDVLVVKQAIKEGRYAGKQLDWGAWGLKLTGGEVRALLRNKPEILSALDENKLYVLVVAEDA